MPVWLQYTPWRVSCSRCGVKVERVPWADGSSVFTAAFEESAAYLAQETSQQWQTRWSVKIPMTVVGRLYPRSLGMGSPDLIESSLPFTLDGDETWLSMFPTNVFTKRPTG